MFSKRVWIIFLILIILYGINIQGYEGSVYLLKLPTYLRHAVDYLFLIFFAGIGYFGWITYPLQWAKKLWLVLYTIVIIVIGIAGLIDFKYPITNLSIRDLISSIRVFFTSPLPYGILMLLISFTTYKPKSKIQNFILL